MAEDLTIGTSLLYGWMRKGSQPGQFGSEWLRAVGEEPAADELAQAATRNCDPQTRERHFKKGWVTGE